MQKEIVQNTDWEILTPTGWSDFSGVSKTIKTIMFTIQFTDNTNIKCSESHLLKFPNGEFLEACHILPGDILYGNKEVSDVSYELGEFELYDAIDVSYDSEYYTNDVVSHNCAFIDGIDEIWGSIQQTLATGGKAILLSSPNGTGNFFHKTWVDATTNINSKWNPIRLHWTVHPDRTEKWRQDQEDLLGPRLAAQECDADFISSGATVIAPEILQYYRSMTREPIEKRGFDNNLWIWEYADFHRNYIVAADVSRGNGADYSTLHVFDVETLNQVAEYKGMIGTTEFGHLLVTVATEYNNALLVVENANVGWAVIQTIIERGYSNLYHTNRDITTDINLNQQLARGVDVRNASNSVPGFTTSSKTRPLLISKLETMARHKELIINSIRLLEELSVFIWNGSKPEAQHGYNDDLVMSYSIGIWVRDNAFKLMERGRELTQVALSHITKTSSNPILTTPNSSKSNPWSMPIGLNKNEDLTWLL
jgi:hypothetical protein